MNWPLTGMTKQLSAMQRWRAVFCKPGAPLDRDALSPLTLSFAILISATTQALSLEVISEFRTDAASDYDKFIAMELSSDANTLLYANADGLLASVDVFTMEVTEKLNFNERILDFEVSSDGRRLVIAVESSVQYWDFENEKLLWQIQKDFGWNPTARIEINATNDLLLVKPQSGRDGFEVVNLESKARKTLESSKDYPFVEDATFAPDGRHFFVLSSGYDGTSRTSVAIDKWSTSSDRLISSQYHKGEYDRLAAGRDGNTLAILGPSTGGQWVDLNNLKVVNASLDGDSTELIFEEPAVPFSAVERVFFDDAQKSFLATTYDGRYFVYDMAVMKVVDSGSEAGFVTDRFRNSSSAMSLDRRFLATARSGNHNFIRIYAMPGSEGEVLNELAFRDQLNQLKTALSENNAQRLSEVLDPALIFETNPNPPLMHVGVRHGSASGVELLIAEGADLNALDRETGWSALMLAANLGKEDIVNSLLLFGARTDVIGQDGTTFLYQLLKSDIAPGAQTAAAKLKGEMQALIKEIGLEQILLSAAQSGNRQVVSTMLRLGASANAADDQQRTALMHASVLKHPDAEKIVEDLLSLGGADASLSDASGSTALELAIASNAPEPILRQNIRHIDLKDSRLKSRVWDLARKLSNETAISLLSELTWQPPNISAPRLLNIEVDLSPSMTKSQIADAQRVLQSKDLYQSSIDGIWGPASRRGLAAYFKVLFDEYYEQVEQFCGSVSFDIANRIEADPDSVAGWLLRDGTRWTVKEELVYGRVTASVITPDRMQIECELQMQAGELSPAVAKVLWFASDAEGEVRIKFDSSCAANQYWERVAFRKNYQNVAVDFPCLRTMAGVPLSPGKITEWRKY